MQQSFYLLTYRPNCDSANVKMAGVFMAQNFIGMQMSRKTARGANRPYWRSQTAFKQCPHAVFKRQKAE